MADEVIIQEVAAKVRVLDGAGILNPRILGLVVAATLDATEERRRLEARRREDTQLPGSNQDDVA